MVEEESWVLACTFPITFGHQPSISNSVGISISISNSMGICISISVHVHLRRLPKSQIFRLPLQTYILSTTRCRYRCLLLLTWLARASCNLYLLKTTHFRWFTKPLFDPTKSVSGTASEGTWTRINWNLKKKKRIWFHNLNHTVFSQRNFLAGCLGELPKSPDFLFLPAKLFPASNN